MSGGEGVVDPRRVPFGFSVAMGGVANAHRYRSHVVDIFHE